MLERQWKVVARWALVLAATLLVAGCALGNHGALLARYTYTTTALVLDVYSTGVHLRASGDDAGATLGYRRASYVFTRGPADCQPGSSTWRWFRAPWPDGSPLLRASRVAGVEVSAGPGIRRIAVGYLDQVVTVGPDAGESRVVEIHYDRTNAARTHVRTEEIQDDAPSPGR